MKIYKYNLEITDSQKIYITGLVKILSVMVQYEKLVLYALIEPGALTEISVTIIIAGTGHEIFPNSCWRFLGTHKMANGQLMWHVWNTENEEVRRHE